MNSPLNIDYYSDVLCVWAWIAERRNAELTEQWGDKIQIRHHYINLFGNVAAKMQNQWAERGGYDGFANHVVEAAAPYDNAPVNPDIWQGARPTTSANAHLLLKAAEISHSAEVSAALADQFRYHFFVEGADISQVQTLLDIAGLLNLNTDKLMSTLEDGTAMAALMQDYQVAQELGIKGSPTWIMNNGRQILFGNVGFRVLNANIKEILSHPAHEASWC